VRLADGFSFPELHFHQTGGVSDHTLEYGVAIGGARCVVARAPVLGNAQRHLLEAIGGPRHGHLYRGTTQEDERSATEREAVVVLRQQRRGSQEQQDQGEGRRCPEHGPSSVRDTGGGSEGNGFVPVRVAVVSARRRATIAYSRLPETG